MRHSQRGRVVWILLVLIVLGAGLATLFSGKLGTVSSLIERDGVAGIFYRAKDIAGVGSPNVRWESDASAYSRNEDGLDALWSQLADSNTQALLIAQHGKLVFERYRAGRNANDKMSLAAMGKFVTAGLGVMLAADDGVLTLDDPLHKFVPEWEAEPRKRQIKFRHILTHSSGLDDVSFGDDSLAGWKKEYFDNPPRRFRMALDTAGTLFDPGSDFGYSGVGFYALAWAVAKAYEERGVTDLRKLMHARLMGPLGIPRYDWAISYGTSYDVDGTTMYALGSGGTYTPRAVARIGQLILDRGEYGGRQLLKADTVAQLLAYGGLPPERQASIDHPAAGGIGSWSNCDGFWRYLPRDSALALGGSHNFLLVAPSADLVVVRAGGSIPKRFPGQAHWAVIDEAVFRPLMALFSVPENAGSGAAACGPQFAQEAE